MKYKIDYEHGKAELYTPSLDWEGRFYELASQCFGIRKSLGEVKLLNKEDTKPNYEIVGEYERLEHNGDLIVWDKDGNKIKSEWD
jgi:hypothetical protein